jgi:II/X family phage/plasmid replication protein
MAAMIDWITARVPCTLPGYINGGAVVFIDAAGKVERETDRRLQVRGSHDSSLAVRGGGGELEISGNPAKWLQGHNVFGSSHPIKLVYYVMRRLMPLLNLGPTLADRRAWLYGDYDLLRVDATRMYDLGSNAEVVRFLSGAAVVAKGRYQKASAYGSDTVYIGQKSSRVTVKFYNKLQEMTTRGHLLPDTLPAEDRAKLLEFVEGQLRYELTLRSKELAERGLRSALAWSSDTADRLLNERLEKIELNDALRLAEEVVDQLPPKLVPIYDAWRAGRDLKHLYAKNTFYRYRRQLLAYQIDIAEVRPREVVSQTQYLMGGRSLKSFLVGPGVSVPDWAKGTDLLVG